jgi:hypothetical protein
MNLASRHASDDQAHDPADRFRRCHAVILDGLGELRRLPMLLDALQQARLTAEATLELFERQVFPHHLDEEQVLFVATLRNAAKGPERERVEELVTRLVAQHRRLEHLWLHLRPAVVAMAEGKMRASATFRDEVMTLVDAYLDHSRLEERVFLPLADEIMSRSQDQASPLDPAQHMRPAARGSSAHAQA